MIAQYVLLVLLGIGITMFIMSACYERFDRRMGDQCPHTATPTKGSSIQCSRTKNHLGLHKAYEKQAHSKIVKVAQWR